ncbi:MAG: adenosylhomocysteinase [Acidimicrobiales bacterium]
MHKEYDIKDASLAELGKQRIEWADANMPVLASIRERFSSARPLEGARVAACLHITTETANLLRTLSAGGAEVVACASNPLSTQDDVAASLVQDFGIPTYAVRGEDESLYYQHIDACIDTHPTLTMDDGCDLVSRLHRERPELAAEVTAGTEETTTGVIRLRAMESAGALRYPIIAVNDAYTKHLFDNRYGTGQSTLDGIIRATNVLLAGKKIVVAGYGNCGRGVASRSRGMGAQVIVCEVDPLRSLEAVMDGFRVEAMEQAAREGDIFITVTGDRDVLRAEHFAIMRDGAILANSGHFDIEIDLKALAKMSGGNRREVRHGVEEFQLEGSPGADAAGESASGNPGAGRAEDDGGTRRVYVIAEGRLVNLSAAEGHPAAVMDMSFANQALCSEWAVDKAADLECKVHPVPSHIDEQVARLKLDSLGVEIDTLTSAQIEYLHSWNIGT